MVDKKMASMLPLEGVRVLDLTMFWAGPAVTYVLATYGAEVIKIESIQHPDGYRTLMAVERTGKWWEKATSILGPSINKYGLTLDLTKPKGQETFKELVKISDVVVDNFPPRVMKNFGLEYQVLKEINPTIIMHSMPGFGASGPWKNTAAYALNIEQMAGWAYVTGYEGDIPITPKTSDPIQGYAASFSIIMALEHRRRTGEGQYIDHSQSEALALGLGPAVIASSKGQPSPERMGNRHLSMAPHGCYPCRGDDQWLVIAVADDDEWQRFCKAVSHPEWGGDPRFIHLADRLKHQVELDELVKSWTRLLDGQAAMFLLQRDGIAAGIVAGEAEMWRDPQLWHRDAFQPVPRAITGTIHTSKLPFKMSKTPLEYRMAAPLLGEHNEYILGDILGLTGNRLEELERAKVIGKEPLMGSE